MKRPFALIALALACALATPARAQDVLALLLIDVRAQMVKDTTRDPGVTRGATDAFWVRNLETGTSYGGRVNGSTVTLLDVPAGTYCLDRIDANDETAKISYCAAPYFKVVGGQLNNAGRWRLGIGIHGDRIRLLASMEDLPGVLRAAHALYPQRITVGPL